MGFSVGNGSGQSKTLTFTTENWALPQTVEVEIADTGPGFEPDQAVDKNGRLGLTGMRERVESLGGLYRIESQVGQGSRVMASLPIQFEGGGEK